MNLTVNQESLSAALAITSRAVSSRTTMPILANVMLHSMPNRLHLSATNREIHITTIIGAQEHEAFATTVPARLLSEFVSSLPPERIKVELLKRTETLRLKCGKFSANIKGISADDFPLPPTFDEVEPIIIPAADLRTMIDKTIYAASTDENRPTLTGIEVRLGDKLTMAATDGFRLAYRENDAGVDADVSVIVPGSALATVAKIAGDAKGGAGVYATEDRIKFVFEGGDKAGWQRCEVATELIAAKYPDYSSVTPSHATTTAKVDSAELAKAVRVASLFARDNNNIVRFGLSADGLKLTAESAEMGSNESTVAAEVSGKQMEIAMNAKYVLDMLTQNPGEITLEFTEPTRPMKATNGSAGHDVLMPMHPPR